jgi:phosphomannomutase
VTAAESSGLDETESPSEPRPEASLIAAAKAWRRQDPDEETRAELDALITGAKHADADAIAELHSRFDARLVFGTAGLRGELAAGPNRMNRVLVSQAAAGLAAYLLGHIDEPSIVIGYDGRKNSEVFARDTAEIMAGAGVHVILLPRMLPTPVLAFAVRHFEASAGVMVTASHNPPNDNGYKVYLGGDSQGSQIVSPVDAEIEAHINRIAAERKLDELPRDTAYVTADDAVVDEYVRRTVELAPASAQPLRYVYTAMHGVGLEVARRVFLAAGFDALTLVEEQAHPDPAFPTVAFPNPEEPGAMDLALAKAEEVGADLIIANDPDADRLAVAVPHGDEWRSLSGNEVGSLLGWRAAERIAAGGANGGLAASVVSSPALRHIAQHFGLDYTDTLTGFKWVSRVENLAYGYEEALGYLVDPGKVRDKDGISAALDFLALMSDLAAAGTTLAEHLDRFDREFGAFASSQVSLRVTDTSVISTIMASLRSAPPTSLGSLAVESIDDFSTGVGTFPPSDILRINLEGGSRVIVRPSGTEPKLKAYIDAAVLDGPAEERRAKAQGFVDELEAAMRELIA